jgi:hypothetical protein
MHNQMDRTWNQMLLHVVWKMTVLRYFKFVTRSHSHLSSCACYCCRTLFYCYCLSSDKDRSCIYANVDVTLVCLQVRSKSVAVPWKSRRRRKRKHTHTHTHWDKQREANKYHGMSAICTWNDCPPLFLSFSGMSCWYQAYVRWTRGFYDVIHEMKNKKKKKKEAEEKSSIKVTSSETWIVTDTKRTVGASFDTIRLNDVDRNRFIFFSSSHWRETTYFRFFVFIVDFFFSFMNNHLRLVRRIINRLPYLFV